MCRLLVAFTALLCCQWLSADSQRTPLLDGLRLLGNRTLPEQVISEQIPTPAADSEIPPVVRLKQPMGQTPQRINRVFSARPQPDVATSTGGITGGVFLGVRVQRVWRTDEAGLLLSTQHATDR